MSAIEIEPEQLPAEPCARTDDHDAHSWWVGTTNRSCLGVPAQARIDQINADMLARPAAVHAIRDQRFVCLGTPECECHRYSGSAADSARCVIAEWVNAAGLSDTFDIDDERAVGTWWDVDSWPDGEVAWRNEVGDDGENRITWRYVDDALNAPLEVDE